MGALAVGSRRGPCTARWWLVDRDKKRREEKTQTKIKSKGEYYCRKEYY